MAAKSESMDSWRKFFQSTNSDIFEVIEQAMAVAAVDFPKEFRARRVRIAEMLFSCRLSRCFGCNNVELQVPVDGDDLGEEEGGGSVKREVGEKGSKVDSSNGEHEDLNRVGLSNYSYDEAEGITDAMDEKDRIVEEVLRLKEILSYNHNESDAILSESLRQLQMMKLSFETLKATEIGRTVNGLRKHNSKQIRHLVRNLIEGWKGLVDEWVNSVAAISDQSPDSVNPAAADEEEGLPSPPMDEGALLATQTTSIELSEFFDGMDDDGISDFRASGVNEISVSESHGPVRRQEPSQKLSVVRQSNPLTFSNAQPMPQGIANKITKASVADSGPGRPIQLNSEPKRSSQFSGVPRKPSNISKDKSNNSEEAAACAKLEQAKRKLQEGYQQAENAKKQRTIQVMELQDLPKQSHNRASNMKLKNQVKNWGNTRR